jgi:hypothetical protein
MYKHYNKSIKKSSRIILLDFFNIKKHYICYYFVFKEAQRKIGISSKGIYTN